MCDGPPGRRPSAASTLRTTGTSSAARTRRSPRLPEEPADAVQRPGVDDVLRLEPSPPRGPDPEPHVLEVTAGVAVRLDCEDAPRLLRLSRLRAVQIHPVRV